MFSARTGNRFPGDIYRSTHPRPCLPRCSRPCHGLTIDERAELSAPLRDERDPRMLRHTFITTMLDAGVDWRDVQIAARHADPRTTMRYDRARSNLDRHPNYILADYMASGT